MTEERKIELSVEVPGTPEEVWEAIATGPGISSWYVPHQVEERQGGAALASFGEAPEMQIPGRVAAWEPPRRIVFDGGEGAPGLAFEWLVAARDDGTCVVRLVNTGFGSGEEWDAQYDGMSEGWLLFLTNLRLHLTHFRGQRAVSMLPMGVWPSDRTEAWSRLTERLGIPADPAVGVHLRLDTGDGLMLEGTVLESQPCRLALLVDGPARGTAFVAAEGYGEQTGISVWAYLYGPDGAAVVERDGPRWAAWLAAQA